MQSVSVGLSGSAEWTVTIEMSASAIGSGEVAVFSTPMLVALVEAAAVNALEGHLPDGKTSVGTRMEIAHLAATPVGMAVRSTATLTQVDKHRLVFTAEAWDESEKIGDATHVRYVVDHEKFEASAGKKSEDSGAQLNRT